MSVSEIANRIKFTVRSLSFLRLVEASLSVSSLYVINGALDTRYLMSYQKGITVGSIIFLLSESRWSLSIVTSLDSGIATRLVDRRLLLIVMTAVLSVVFPAYAPLCVGLCEIGARAQYLDFFGRAGRIALASSIGVRSAMVVLLFVSAHTNAPGILLLYVVTQTLVLASVRAGLSHNVATNAIPDNRLIFYLIMQGAKSSLIVWLLFLATADIAQSRTQAMMYNAYITIAVVVFGAKIREPSSFASPYSSIAPFMLTTVALLAIQLTAEVLLGHKYFGVTFLESIFYIITGLVASENIRRITLLVVNRNSLVACFAVSGGFLSALVAATTGAERPLFILELLTFAILFFWNPESWRAQRKKCASKV